MRNETEVLNRGAATILSAGGKGELVLAGQLEGERVGQQAFGRGNGLGLHVEDRVGADGGIRAGDDVANGVTPATLGGKAGLGQGALGGDD